MNLIKESFNNAKKQKRKAFVAYVTAGDPDFDTSLEIIFALAKAGVDIIELGVPFSDPLADGETIQHAATRALEAGTTPVDVLRLAKKTKEKYPKLPLVLFTYLNPIAFSRDFAAYCKQAAESGIDAILPLDLPPEEADEYRKIIDDTPLPIVSLIAPNTKENRIPLLSRYANAFVYYICREGVTGERKNFAKGVAEKVKQIRNFTDLPIVVGFGISSPKHVKQAVTSGVDGVVVGSAIVKKVEEIAKGKIDIKYLRKFVSDMVKATKEG